MAGRSGAEVSKEKIVNYLLAHDHPVGGDKAAFFVAVGYSRQDWVRLRDDLSEIAHVGDVVSESTSRFGVKSVIDGVVQSPSGRMIGLRTVWISDQDDGPLRLVTAYPS